MRWGEGARAAGPVRAGVRPGVEVDSARPGGPCSRRAPGVREEPALRSLGCRVCWPRPGVWPWVAASVHRARSWGRPCLSQL